MIIEYILWENKRLDLHQNFLIKIQPVIFLYFLQLVTRVPYCL